MEKEKTKTIKSKNQFKQDYTILVRGVKNYYLRFPTLKDLENNVKELFPKGTKTDQTNIKKLISFPDNAWVEQYGGSCLQTNSATIENKNLRIETTSWLIPKKIIEKWEKRDSLCPNRDIEDVER